VVAEISERLDRVPLAIELAAAHVKLLPPTAMLERLESRLELLVGGVRDAPARQQTLRTTLDWSYRLLEDDEQRLFRRLAVFVGGCTLEAAEEVCASEHESVMRALEALVDKSLIRRLGTDILRFAMLETIREYALERLASSGEEDVLRRGHARYYLALAETAEPELEGPAERHWLERLELEHDNLRAALGFALESGDAETGLRMAAALRRFWQIHGHLVEARRSFETALALDGDVPLLARQKATNGLGIMLAEQGDFDGAEPLFTRALELAHELGPLLVLAAQSIDQRLRLRHARRERREEELILFRMMQLLGELVDVMDHRAEDSEVRLDARVLRVARELLQRVQHGRDRAVLVTDFLDRFHEPSPMSLIQMTFEYDARARASRR
jgi:tetratricopeptide (TPR) repeat protein